VWLVVPLLFLRLKFSTVQTFRVLQRSQAAVRLRSGVAIGFAASPLLEEAYAVLVELVLEDAAPLCFSADNLDERHGDRPWQLQAGQPTVNWKPAQSSSLCSPYVHGTWATLTCK